MRKYKAKFEYMLCESKDFFWIELLETKVQIFKN